MGGCTCGCCAGVTVETPIGISNAQGLSAIAYRVGDWGTVKATALSRLSSSDFPALSGLTTRGDADRLPASAGGRGQRGARLHDADGARPAEHVASAVSRSGWHTRAEQSRPRPDAADLRDDRPDNR